MISYPDLVQGTKEWRLSRSGIPTASGFSKILTPKTMKLSSQADDYENRCVAEIIIGMPIEDFGGTRATERGKELEADAFAFYEMNYGGEVTHMGFITNDAKTFGCSPDGLVGDSGMVELKAPGAQTHVGYLLHPEGAYSDYKAQVQGQLLASERDWCDIMSYYPTIKPSVYRVHRDDAYLKLLAEQIAIFTDNVHRKLAIIRGDVEALGKVA